MKVLIINAGSSSIKYQVFSLHPFEQALCSGWVEKIGEPTSVLVHQVLTRSMESEFREEAAVATHEAAMSMIVQHLQDPVHGVIGDISEIDGVGHRVVHCGEAFSDAALINDEVFAAIQDHIPLAPLHNPPNLMGIEVARQLFPDTPQVAVFDTAFHQSIPAQAYLYALPYDYYTQYRIRRYGFHGTSHKYITAETAAYLSKPMKVTSLISIHLGNGCSMAAIHNGHCVDTTMGLTPLEGLVMGTRCGDLDPAIHEYLAGQTGLSLKEITTIMNKGSGLKGLCGTNDMRDVTEKVSQGDAQAALALDIYCYRIKKYIGAYSAVLPDLDAIVFTAGVGQNAAIVRERICQGMERIGIILDSHRNAQTISGAMDIHAAYSPVKILVIPTREELQIARETKALLESSS
jgi:acetate kinase